MCVKILFCAKNNIFIVDFYVLEGQCEPSQTWDGAAIIYETNNQMYICDICDIIAVDVQRFLRHHWWKT